MQIKRNLTENIKCFKIIFNKTNDPAVIEYLQLIDYEQ